MAPSSFGTHVANLAGVPIDVVERAEVVSRDFALKFKEKIEGRREQVAGQLPLVAQADFAYLYKLATGTIDMPEDTVRRREVLKGLKAAVKSYLSAS